jgi:uncharacterized protein YidB (DUF937 family)
MPSSSSTWIALLGLLAVAGYQNRDRLGEIFNSMTGPATPPAGTSPSGGRLPDQPHDDGLIGQLRNLFGGSDGGGLSRGLNDLLGRFVGSGQGDVARSWIETGPNREPTDMQLQAALGDDGVEALMRQTGLSREELFARLKSVLPTAVDKLTPEGRLPNGDEADRWMGRA